MPFELQNPENLSTVFEITDFANEMTDYMIGPALLIAIFSITSITMLSAGRAKEDSIVASLWITTISGMLLSLVPNMLNSTIVLGLAIVTALASVFLFRGQR